MGWDTICEAEDTLARMLVAMMFSRSGVSAMRKLTMEVVEVVEECESSAWRLRPFEPQASEWMSPAISLERSCV